MVIHSLDNIELNGDADEPVTKREFAEAMEMVARSFGYTNERIDGVEGRMDSLEERMDRLEIEVKGLRQDVQELKQEIRDLGDRIFDRIDAAVENRQIDLGAAKSEQVQAVVEKVGDHETRIQVLEKG